MTSIEIFNEIHEQYSMIKNCVLRVVKQKLLLSVLCFIFNDNLIAQLPSNDSLRNAIMIIAGVKCISESNGSLTGATVEAREPKGSCMPASLPLLNSVWYKFKAPASGLVLISTDFFNINTVKDIEIVLYRLKNGIAVIDSLQEIDCSLSEELNGRLDPFPSIAAKLVPDSMYYIQIGGETPFNSTTPMEGSFCIQVEEMLPPANDEPCNAISVSVDSLAKIFSNVGATAAQGESVLMPANNSADPLGNDSWGGIFPAPAISSSVWFKFIGPSSGVITLDLSDISVIGNFNARIQVFDIGNCADYSTYKRLFAKDNTLITSDNNNGQTSIFPKLMVGCLTPGKTYYIMVDGSNKLINSNSQKWGRFAMDLRTTTSTSLGNLPDYKGYGAECAGDKFGYINLSQGLIQPYGGIPPYSLNWSNNSSSIILNGVIPGTYTFKVTDACGTIISKEYKIPGPDSMIVTVDAPAKAKVGDTIRLSAKAGGGSAVDTERMYHMRNITVAGNARQVLYKNRLLRSDLRTQVSTDTIPASQSIAYGVNGVFALVNNKLYSINISTGKSSLVDTVKSNEAKRVNFIDLAYDPISQSLVALGTDTDTLSAIYQINISTVAVTRISPIQKYSYKIAIDNSGKIYSIVNEISTIAHNLYATDRTIGKSNFIGLIGRGGFGFSDFNVDLSTNTLIANQIGGQFDKIDATNGSPIPYFRSTNVGSSPWTLAPKSVEPYKYAWKPSKGISDTTSASTKVIVDTARSWTVTVTDICGTSITKTIRVDISTPFKDQLLKYTSFQVYPNPSTNETVLNLSLPKAQPMTISMTDVLGNLLSSKQIQSTDHYIEKLNVSKLPGGFYFINVHTASGVASKKLVITK